MALFKIFKGLKKNLPTDKYIDGWCYVTTDDGKMYIDTKDNDSSGRIVLNAEKADKLTVSTGSTSQPVYFKDGVPTKTNYTIKKSVPSDAVFTDTHNVSSNIINKTASSTADTTSALTNGNVYLNHIDGGAVTSSHKISGSGATSVTADSDGNIIISSTNSTYGAAGSGLGLVKSGGDVTITDGVINVNDNSHGHIIGNIEGLQDELNSKADANQGIYYIEGTGSTAGIWLGNHSGISEYYNGLILAYKIPIAGNSNGTTLNINGLGAITVRKNNNSAISTSFPVNSVIFLVYTTDGGTAYWKAHDYDSNTRYTVGDYQQNGVKLYLIGSKSTDTATSTSYANSYTNANIYIGTDNKLYATKGFAGIADQAINDGTGNNIVNTYATKTNAISSITGDGSSATINYTKADGTTGSFTTKNTTYSAATSSKEGLMSAADKAKLDGITTGANNYTLPTASSTVLGGVKIGNNVNISSGVISVPAASGTVAGVTIVYPAAKCTTFTSDSGTITPAAVKKAVDTFAITKVAGGTFSNDETTQGGQPSLTWKTWGINENTPYIGYATDQSDGTFILASLKGTDYATGLAIGGGSGNLLWKGNKVAVVGDIPAVGNGTITIKQAGVSKGTFTTNQNGNTTIELTDNNTTYSDASTTAAGLMSAADKTKLDGIAAGANNYSLSLASSSTRGGVKIGYTQSGKNYPVQLSSEKMYVNVPWTDTHHEAYLYATDSSGTAHAATTDGNTYLRLIENSTARSSIKVAGAGLTTVSSDTNGNITISTLNGTNAGDSNTPVYLNGGTFTECTSLDLNTTGSAAKLAGGTTLTSSTIDGFLEKNIVKWAPADASAVGNNGGIIMSFGWSDVFGAQIWLDDDSDEGGMKFRNRTSSSWNDWRQVLTEYNYNSYSPTLTGTGASGTWGISITGNAATATVASSCSGNAATATKLATAQTIKLTGDVTGSARFTGNSECSITATVADNSHNHNYAGSSSAGGPANSANILNNHANSTVTTGTGTWSMNPWGLTNPKVVWGQNFRDSTVSTDSGDMSLVCAANSSSGGYGVHLCIDGGIATLGNIHASKVYGAVWNDYAEFRAQKEIIEPGYCVASANNGQVYKTTEKFQACDGIVSDTFGFSIGETDECTTPLAVAGRVLAYFHGNREDYNAGDTVCAGPEGKVMKMTRAEIKEYPDRIVGIVSEIPEYKTWGSGNVEVNNRIWIKVK